MDGICERQYVDESIGDLFRLVQMYKPMGVGIEVTGQQGGFVRWIQEQMMVRNTWFTMTTDGNSNEPGIRPNTNKMQRFNTVVPMFKAKKIYFPNEMKLSKPMKECMDELSLVSNAGFKSKHDDFADTISMLSVMKPFKPSGEGSQSFNEKTSVCEMDEPEDNDSPMSSYIV